MGHPVADANGFQFGFPFDLSFGSPFGLPLVYFENTTGLLKKGLDWIYPAGRAINSYLSFFFPFIFCQSFHEEL